VYKSLNISQACQQCHRWSDEELRQRVTIIQDRTAGLLKKSEAAILDAIDAIKAAMASRATDEQLKQARHLHRRAQMRWDFVASENSMGFHSPQGPPACSEKASITRVRHRLLPCDCAR